jgi:AraC-like DNA-binding protein
MKINTSIANNKRRLFWMSSSLTIVIASLFIFFQYSKGSLNILPILIEIRNHEKPMATPDTFAEDFTNNASKGKLLFNKDNTFSFKYTKSPREGHAFTGCYFPLENENINFSEYDVLEVDIKTKLSRRIPINLSVQNNLETYQYIRQFIEIKEGQTLYKLELKKFFTPSAWFDRNNVSQVEIPEPDMTNIGAMSFESCHLLERSIEDEFTIRSLILKKNLSATVVLTIGIVVVLMSLFGLLFLDLFKKKAEVIHVPIVHNEFEQKKDITGDIIGYLAKNYTNPNLTLAILTKEFGKSNSDISNIIKERSSLTFPKYLNYLRLEEAKRLLKIGDYKTVSEVGYTVGFNSPSNFIRVFKGQEGPSPKKFAEDN